MISFTHRTKLILAFGLIYIVWGTTFFGIHIALKSFPPFLFSSLRLLIAGIALSLFCIYRRESLPPVNEIFRNALFGQIIFIGGMVSVVWAQQFISSSLASTIITTPFWFVLLDRKQWKFYFSTVWIPGGLLVGLVGVILLMVFKTGRIGQGSDLMQTVAILLIIGGSFMWASVSLYLRYQVTKTSVYVSTSIQLLSAGVTTFFISLFVKELGTFELANIQWQAVVSLFYLGLISSLLGFLAYIWLITVQPPAIVSTYSYVNPLVATLLGWAFANESISSIQLLALSLILVGVLFVNLPKYYART